MEKFITPSPQGISLPEVVLNAPLPQGEGVGCKLSGKTKLGEGGLIIWLLIFVWLLVFGYWSFPAMAALDLSEIGVGARPLGMGKAFVGAADDASAIFINPAGLSRNDNLNMVSMAGTMLGDINYVMLGASDLSPMGKFGFGYINASTGGIPLTRITGTGSTAAVVQYDSTDYSSSLIFFSYGSKLSRFLKGGAGSTISLGLSLKWFLQGFSGGGTAMQDATGAGMDADLGLMWDARPWMTLGLAFQNFLPESFGGKFEWKKNSVTEGIPMTIRTGGKFKLIGSSALRESEDQKLDLTLDYESNQQPNRPSVLHAGIEYRPMDMFALRVGMDQKPKAAESGTGVDNNLTAGVGIELAGFTFDYAYHQFGELSENTTHFFSIGYRGEEKYVAGQKKKPEKKKPGIPLPEVVPKPKLKTFADVPEGYWAKKPIEYLATLGIMDGYDDRTFRPTQEMTRGELAVLLIKAKGFTVGKEVRVRFSDVKIQSYEAPYISLAVERKYVSGYPNGTFKPEKRVTRAEAAVILAKFAGLYMKPKVQEKVFEDLPVKHWASPAAAATKESGFFEYLGGKGFGPNLYLTRAEAAEIISKTTFAKKQIEKLISGEK